MLIDPCLENDTLLCKLYFWRPRPKTKTKLENEKIITLKNHLKESLNLFSLIEKHLAWKRTRKTHLSFKNKTKQYLFLFFLLFSSKFLYLPIDPLIGRAHMLEDKQSAVWLRWKPLQKKSKLAKLIYVFPILKNGKFDSKVCVDRSSLEKELILHSRKWSRALKRKKNWPV